MSATPQTVHPEVRAIMDQIEAINTKAMSLITHLQEERDSLKAALQRMVTAHDDLTADTEGRYPMPDSGCIDCTLGTVPNHLNTGTCAYHAAVRLLKAVGPKGDAGPGLMPALRSLLAQATDTCGVIEEFVAMPCQSLQDKFPTTVARLKSKIADARAAIAKAEGR